MLEHFIGPGTIKAGLKVADHLTGGACHGAVEMMEEITSSPGYTKYRIDNARDTISDFWDDHKESVGEFVDNIGDSISDGFEAVGEIASDGLEIIGDFISGIF